MTQRWNGHEMEKLCFQCQTWWPKTTEFFYEQHGYMYSPCKACQAETRAKNNAHLPCCVPGCGKPRYKFTARTDSRCVEHRREYERERKARKAVHHGRS